MSVASNKEIQSHYDFIIVGAGAAGSGRPMREKPVKKVEARTTLTVAL